MIIGDGNSAPAGGELLERMREAYRPEAADAVDQAAEAAGTDATSAADSAAGAEAPAAVDGLESRLLDTAASALDGEFASAKELREAVVEAIIAERYADKLPQGQAEQLTRTLTATLGDDPAFRAEVDDMLVHAARQLARRSG